MAVRGLFVPREILENPLIAYVGYSGYGEVDNLKITKAEIDHDPNFYCYRSSENKLINTQCIVAFTMKNVN